MTYHFSNKLNIQIHNFGPDAWVYVRDLEAILVMAPVVRAQIPKRETEIFWSKNPTPANDDTHTARLLMIEEIKPKEVTAEELLRDLVLNLEHELNLRPTLDKAREYLKAKESK